MEKYRRAFADYEAFLSSELLDGMETLNTSKEEAILSDSIFARLHDIPLVDQYSAYQLLDEEWKKIAIDLEIIQTEGFAAAKQVDPNMVIKKKDGKDQEVQDGWIGHVIPFSIVQETMLSTQLNAIKECEDRLSEITAEYEALLDELSEDEKEKAFVNDAKDAFVAAEVKKVLKSKEAEPETLVVLKKVDALTTEEKSLKKQVKDDSNALHLLTKKTIEELDDAKVMELIKLKWISPLVNSIAGLPNTVLNVFVAKLEALCSKYDTTFAEVEQQISDTEASLISLLDNLTGNEFDMKGISELKSLLGGE